MSPIGMILGGLIITFGEIIFPRDLALRLPYMFFIIVQILSFLILTRILKNADLNT